MSEPTASALTARQEQVKAEGRPQRLSGLDIKGAVAEIRDTSDLYKVYRPEWLVVYTSVAPGLAGEAEAAAHFAERYEGRVHAEDVQYAPASVVQPDNFPHRLLLRLPNIKGEFKYRELAEAYVVEQGWDPLGVQIVSRNSRDEFTIKDYSVKRLPQVRP